MEINILQVIDGAKKAKGLTVIIDVFRAFSVACYAYGKGIKKIIPVGDLALAYELRSANENYVLIGERDGKVLPEFNFGNSPTQIIGGNLRGKVAVHTTSAGTQGIVNAKGADEIITGSFVNADAIVRYIKQKNPEIVSLVCMGYASQEEAEEDTLCAQYIMSSLNGTYLDDDKIKETLTKGAGKRFFEARNQSWLPENDFHLCTDFNIFNFVLKAEKDEVNDLYYLRKIDI